MRIKLLLVFVLALFFANAGTAQARFLSIVCAANQDAQVDPIVSPGVYPSAHLHTFYAARGVTQNSTVASLEASTSSCVQGGFADGATKTPMSSTRVAGDTAGMWEPTAYNHGVELVKPLLADYWSNTGIPTNVPLSNVPEGLQFVIGNAHATSPPPKFVLYWNCGGSFVTTWPSSTTPYNTCPDTGAHSLQAHLTFPDCWDGTGLTPADTTYGPIKVADFAGGPAFGPCPAAFPIQLPHMQLILHTHIAGDATGLSFSSGPYYTLHGDYWQTWKQSILQGNENWLRTGVLPTP